MTKFQELKFKVLTALGITEFPFENGKLNLENPKIVDLKAAIDEADFNDFVAKLEQERAELENLRQELKASKEAVEKLSQKAEEDLPPTIITGHQKIVGGYLFGVIGEWNRIDNKRPWNQRAAARMANQHYIGATGYTETDIQTMIDDLGAYSRQDMNKLITYGKDSRRLPSFWPVITGVNDEGVIEQLFSGEVTQGRKKGFLPKGKFTFVPEMYKMFPAQIDLMFIGHELQKMEESWMFKHISTSGSQPDKMPFIQFLISKALEKAAKEDEIGAVNGVYLPISDSATEPGQAINKMRGVRKLLREAKASRKLCAFNVGRPAVGSLLNYVDTIVMLIPEQWRDSPGLVFYMSSSWNTAYIKEYETAKGAYPSFVPGADYKYVDRHENIRLEVLPFLNDSDLMFVTFEDNIVLLENISGEGQLLSLQKQIRDIVGTADYKKSVHFNSFGRIKEVGEVDYIDQMVWLNDVEDLLDIFVPVDADDTTPSVKYHNAIRTGINTKATAITTIDDSVDGQIIVIRGNSGSYASTIANSGNFVLSAAMTLGEFDEISLYKSNSKFIELSRRKVAGTDKVELAADATTADGTKGTHFLTAANTMATAITNITDAETDVIYTIEGGSSTNATTIANSGNFRLSATATLSLGKYVKVKYTGSKFVEMERN